MLQFPGLRGGENTKPCRCLRAERDKVVVDSLSRRIWQGRLYCALLATEFRCRYTDRGCSLCVRSECLDVEEGGFGDGVFA